MSDPSVGLRDWWPYPSLLGLCRVGVWAPGVGRGHCGEFAPSSVNRCQQSVSCPDRCPGPRINGGSCLMRRSLVLMAVFVLVGVVALPAGAAPPGYEEMPFGDGAVCDFTGTEALYGTPGYPEQQTQTVLWKQREIVDGQGGTHQTIKVILDGVQYDLREGDGPESFLVYGTFTGVGWGDEDEALGVLIWKWTLTDLDGNPLGKTGGTIVDFDPPTDGRLVQNWRGPCIEP